MASSSRNRLSARCERRPWTIEEDEKLLQYVRKYGAKRWAEAPKKLSLNRSGNSCRSRWMTKLHPEHKEGPLSDMEEKAIVGLHRSLGNQWSAIAEQIPGRSDNDVKNYMRRRIEKCESTGEEIYTADILAEYENCLLFLQSNNGPVGLTTVENEDHTLNHSTSNADPPPYLTMDLNTTVFPSVHAVDQLESYPPWTASFPALDVDGQGYPNWTPEFPSFPELDVDGQSYANWTPEFPSFPAPAELESYLYSATEFPSGLVPDGIESHTDACGSIAVDSHNAPIFPQYSTGQRLDFHSVELSMQELCFGTAEEWTVHALGTRPQLSNEDLIEYGPSSSAASLLPTPEVDLDILKTWAEGSTAEANNSTTAKDNKP